MSFDNAISSRAQMNITYKAMLEGVTDENRRAAIEKQIKLNLDEIESLRKEQTKLFGPRTPLKPVTTIIEHDAETKGQKVTILNAPPTAPAAAPSITEAPQAPTTTSNKRLGNSLRDSFQAKQAASREASLQAKIAAAKAAKKV